MKKIQILVMMLMTSHFIFAQGIGIGTTTPDASAALEIQSSSKGLLIPRMGTGQRKQIPNPAVGLIIFDTDKGCIYMFDGLQWLPLSFGSGNSLPISSRMQNNTNVKAGFGAVVCLSGNYAVITQSKREMPGNSIDTVFVFYKSGGSWTQQAKLLQSDPMQSDQFGYAVAISGDHILIGAPFRNGRRGAVYAFARNGTNWTQQAILTPAIEQANNYFGCTIAMNGLYTMIGATGWDYNVNTKCGQVYCYTRNAAGWQQTQQLQGIISLGDFGEAISMSGAYALIGAPYAKYNGLTDCGIAYFYKRSGNTWIATDTIYNTGGAAGDAFGYALAISQTNNYAFISRPGTPDVNGTKGFVNEYLVSGNSLVYQEVLKSPYTFTSSPLENGFGISLCMYDEYLVIGAPNGKNMDASDGRVYVFKRDPLIGYQWKHWKTIKDDTMVSNNYVSDTYGISVFINGFTIIMGNPGAWYDKGKIMFAELE